MLYKFKSKAAGDVIMLGPHGDLVLRILGREPAPRGIFELAAMPGMMAALEAAVAADDAARQQRDAGAAPQRDGSADQGGDGVSLHRRVWPLLEMLRRCHAAGEVIVWGA